MKQAVCISTVSHLGALITLFLLSNWAWDNNSYKIVSQENTSIQAQLIYASVQTSPVMEEKPQESRSKKLDYNLQSMDKLANNDNAIIENALNSGIKSQVNKASKSKTIHFDKSEDNSNLNKIQNYQKHTSESEVNQEEEKKKNIDGDKLNELVAHLYQEINKHKKYPRQAFKMAIEGSVEVNFVLFPNNNIEGLKVIASSGSDILDEAALNSIKDAQPFKDVAKYLQGKQEFNLVLKFEL